MRVVTFVLLPTILKSSAYLSINNYIKEHEVLKNERNK